MTPTKPCGGASQASTLAAVSIALSELTPAEIRWVRAYQKMDHRRREENLDLAEADAQCHPMSGKPDTPFLVHDIRLAAEFGKVVTR
ncbi:hypothetical protein [Massilia eurypsychrophila]|uniref:hypothetical protein n=1 Tax=Massilia eurypsychrophila TaxID=1485217 RepID=UPI0010342642|nr:hypothetical protein [Massilia eurypsychrophila]